MIAVMAGGGKLKDEATAHGDVFAEIPKAVQPRMAVFYSFRMLVEVLVAFGVINSSTVQELEDASNHLENSVGPWKKEVLVAENPAKQLAEKLVGKTPIIYSSAHLSAAAYKLKSGANENGKNTALYNLCLLYTSHRCAPSPDHKIDHGLRQPKPASRHAFLEDQLQHR